jgi:hypothetical protein
MKSKQIVLISVAAIVAVLAYGLVKFSMMFCFYGARGPAYETWETANSSLKVRITALYEEGVFLPGAYFVCESAPVGSDRWREFIYIRTDDAFPIRREQFRFVGEQTAYFYMAYDFVVTLDGGRTWKAWKPLFPQSNGEPLYWAIREAKVEADGTGSAKVECYDKQKKARVELEIRTRDFGQSWSVV